MPIFKLIRAFTKPLVLMAEQIFPPSPIIREPMVQQGIDRDTANMAIYEYRGCPFCMRTRRALRRLSLHIELRDALNNPEHKNDLLEKGGKSQVPCLRYTAEDGSEKWMYESLDIIDFLEERYANNTP